MSVTFKRYVNGQVVHYKMSLWDAFKGVPGPRRKKVANPKPSAAITADKSAPDATVTVQTGVATVTITGPATSTPPNATNTGGEASNTIKQGEDETHTFTATDDAKLIEMKAAGQAWKEIVAVMKKSQSALKERFKEIGANAAGGAKNSTTITKQGEDEAHTFTAADDSKLVEMKAAGRTWKDINAETNKSLSALKERFKEIGPKAGGAATITKQGEDEAHTFAAADDAKLVEMKAAGKTWKEINAETNKSLFALKERFKEIGPKADGGNPDTGAGGGEKKKEADGQAAKDKKADNESERTATTCQKCKKEAIHATEATAKSATNESTPNPPVATKSQLALAEIAAKYDKDKWRYAASRYYDFTGIRISPEYARKMAREGNLVTN